MIEENRLRELLLGDPDGKTEQARSGRLKATGLSIEKFARKIGVTRASVYGYMQDRHRPSPETMDKLCKELGIPLSEGLEHCTPRNEGRPCEK